MISLNYIAYAAANNEYHINITNSTGFPLDLTKYTANAVYKKHAFSANSKTFTTNAYANGLLVLAFAANTTTANDIGVYYYTVNINEITSNTTSRIQDGLLTIRG